MDSWNDKDDLKWGQIDAYFIQCTKGEDSGAPLVSFNNGILYQLVDVVSSNSDEILPAETPTNILKHKYDMNKVIVLFLTEF